MALGINETIDSEVKTSKHLVYKENTRVQYTKKDKNIIACILPALADPDDKSSYLPYRKEENPEQFTKWAVGLRFHPFVNRDQNIISPTTFDPTAYDPIDDFIKILKNDPEHCMLAGFGQDGKRMQNAYKNPDVRLSSKWSGYVVNSIILYDRDQDPEKSILLQIPNTAFRKSGPTTDKSQQWGLLSELNRKNRKTDSNSIDSYYWGDITDPRALIPCSLRLTPNPAGGLAIYNMVPIDDEDPVKITKSTLESRYNLDDVFYEITEGEMIDRMIYYFSDVPKLLRRAYASRVPNIDKLIANATATRVSMTEAEEGEDQIDMEFSAAPRNASSKEAAPVAEDSRNFAPADDDLPEPGAVRKHKLDDEGGEEDGELFSDEKVVTVPTRKISKQVGASSETKRSSIRDLMD